MQRFLTAIHPARPAREAIVLNACAARCAGPAPGLRKPGKKGEGPRGPALSSLRLTSGGKGLRPKRGLVENGKGPRGPARSGLRLKSGGTGLRPKSPKLDGFARGTPLGQLSLENASKLARRRT